MLFKKTMQKTKKIFLKTLQNMRNFFFGSYENIPKTLFLNPLSCSSINQRNRHLDHIYPTYSSSNQSSPLNSEQDRNNPDQLMKQIINIDAIHITANSSECEPAEEMKKEVTKKEVVPRKKQSSTPSSTRTSFRFADGGAQLLAQKMKDLEMMNVRDVDHSLDVEEALHYYSRLTCPEYVDIVNKFFMDMYADFHPPQRSKSLCSSSRRLGPLAL